MKQPLVRVVAVLVFALGCFGEVFAADGVELQHFRPATNGQGALGVESPVLLEPLQPFFGVTFDFASSPLMKKTEEGGIVSTENVVDYQFISHIQAGFGLLKFFDLGLELPVAVLQMGEVISAPGTSIPGQALGDLAIVPRVRILNSLNDGSFPLSVTLALPVTVPTGDGEAYMGEGGVALNPQLVLGHRYSKLSWNVAVGYRLRPETKLEYPGYKPLELGNELTYGAAATFKALGALHAALELQGSTGFVSGEYYDDPIEARVGVGLESENGLLAEIGIGVGLTGGYGAPLWRGIATVGYVFGPVGSGVHDADEDGIEDEVDQCPDKPEDLDSFEDENGCPDPDNDQDGILDGEDKCPNEAEDVDQFEDEDGCPDADNDNDGIPDATDKCPNEAEDVDQFEDEDGCPDLDHDKDGIPDTADSCPNEAENINGFEDEDGCPEPDEDGDGIPDEIDQCRKLKETVNNYKDEDGCPEKDTDQDGIPNGLDKCPKGKETVNGFQDEDGCPERDRDNDGIPDALDKCPKLKEPMNGILDEDGCPDEDEDNDGIPNVLDWCPKKAEDKNGVKDEDGCPDG